MSSSGRPAWPTPHHVVAIPAGYFPSLHKRESLAQRLISLPILALQHSYVGILTTICSGSLCWYSGYAGHNVMIDPLVFKSIFVIFGFTMGFRNVRANQRYYDVTKETANLFSAFWGIYAPLPTDIRARLRDRLLAVMGQCCEHIHRVGVNPRCCWYGMVGLEPASESFEDDAEQVEATPLPGRDSIQSYGSMEEASPRPEPIVRDTPSSMPRPKASKRPSVIWETEDGSETGVISPRLELVRVLLEVEAGIEPLEPGREQKLKRSFWYHRAQLLSSYDNLLSLAFPSVTERFMIFIDICLFMFAASLPWGVKANDLVLNLGARLFTIDAGFALVVNTTLVVMVMFTLNALTVENENPLSGDADDIDLKRLVDVLGRAVEAHERAELAVQLDEGVQTASSPP